MIGRRPPQKSRSDTTRFVTLHRPPPLTRIFAPGFRAPSRSSTDREGFARRATIAVASPAAPAPTIAMSTAEAQSLRGTSGRLSQIRMLNASGVLVGASRRSAACSRIALQRVGRIHQR